MKLSLRDYLASEAMKQMLARGGLVGPDSHRRVTESCYQYADAMLQARKSKRTAAPKSTDH